MKRRCVPLVHRSTGAGSQGLRWTRSSRGSRELLQAWPTMPATVIAERIGWERGLTVLKDRVRELRPVYLSVDPASRTLYVAGELAQCDLWLPPVQLPVGCDQTRGPAQLPVLTMVTGYSRTLLARLLPTRSAEDLFAGRWSHLTILGSVARAFVWDGEAAVGRWRGGRVELTAACQAFRGTRAAKVLVCRPAVPPTLRPRAWSSGRTTTSSGRSCPGATSPRRRTSTPSSATGSRW